MGADTSLPLPPVKPGFSTMCVSFQYTDRITVLHVDDGGLSIIRQAINEAWQSGIKLENTVCRSGWSFKLNGSPFGETTSSSVSQQARQIVCQILQKLHGNGWKFIITTDLGRHEDKSTMFFKKSSPEFSTAPYLCVGLSSSDKLQIVNLPPQLVEPMKQTIRLHWSLGIQNEDSPNPGVLQVKLRGNPWWSTDEQSIMAKVLLQNIIATLRSYQWVYCCNVNLKSTADSLFFRYDPNIKPGESTQFCTISLNRHDRVRVIAAPENIVAMVRKVIQTTWVHGCIQNEKDYHGSWEFKLSGNPWYSSNEESAMARYLVLKILQAMLEQGWHNIAGIDIARRPNDNDRPKDKSVLVFQKKEPKCCPMMCLSLNDVDKLRLINMPNEMMELFKRVLGYRWPKGIQREQILTLSIGTAYEVKLSGEPWTGGNRNDTIHARSFLCEIIQEFVERGWTLFLSTDVSAKYDDYPIDVHSMWFIYDPAPSAQSSAPTYGFDFATGPSPTQYGMGMPSLQYPSTTAEPYPPPTAPEMPTGYGVQPGPHPNDPPPSYTQATGWNSINGGKQ